MVGSYRFGAPWYTAEELEVLRDEARLFTMVVPGGVENAEGHGEARRGVPVEAKLPSQMRLSYLLKFGMLTKVWSVNGTWIVRELLHEEKTEASGA